MEQQSLVEVLRAALAATDDIDSGAAGVLAGEVNTIPHTPLNGAQVLRQALASMGVSVAEGRRE